MSAESKTVRASRLVLWLNPQMLGIELLAGALAAVGAAAGFSPLFGLAPLAGGLVWYLRDLRTTDVRVTESAIVARVGRAVVETIPRDQIHAVDVDLRFVPLELPTWLVGFSDGETMAFVVLVETKAGQKIPVWPLGTAPADARLLPPLADETKRLLAALNSVPVAGVPPTPVDRRPIRPALKNPRQTSVADLSEPIGNAAPRRLRGMPAEPAEATMVRADLGSSKLFAGLWNVVLAAVACVLFGLGGAPWWLGLVPAAAYLVFWRQRFRGSGALVDPSDGVISLWRGSELGRVALAEIVSVTVEQHEVPLPARRWYDHGRAVNVVTVQAADGTSLALWGLGNEPDLTSAQRQALADVAAKVGRAIEAARPVGERDTSQHLP